VLRGVDLTIHHGDRILLEGSSGGGKSTLAALLVGLRKPESGLLLLNGLDRPTLGDNWQRLATEAPQFHENHILSGTLGFNLLMGRNWPASDEELLAARELCIELGLGPLLERMPAGMMQMVGETGWQLSHGERSRIFLARALLAGCAAHRARRELRGARSRDAARMPELRLRACPYTDGDRPPLSWMSERFRHRPAPCRHRTLRRPRFS
jgi:ABC-type transport system involved in cytochrome bd biosynthesis fused ATPase/permease subunit